MRIVKSQGSAHTCRFCIPDVGPVEEPQEIRDECQRKDHSVKLPPHTTLCVRIDLAGKLALFRVRDGPLLGALILLHVVLDGSDPVGFTHDAGEYAKAAVRSDEEDDKTQRGISISTIRRVSGEQRSPRDRTSPRICNFNAAGWRFASGQKEQAVIVRTSLAPRIGEGVTSIQRPKVWGN